MGPAEQSKNYLAMLRKHILMELKVHYGSEFLAKAEICYGTSVPSFWSNEARTNLCDVYAKAGFEKSGFFLFEDSSAPAQGALFEIGPGELAVGDIFILCDIGGGAADLSSWIITPTGIEECCKVSIIDANITSVDRNFNNCLTTKLSRNTLRDHQFMQDARKSFRDNVKHRWSNRRTKDWEIMPGHSTERLVISGSEMKAIFRPLVDDISRLVTQQIISTGKHVQGVIISSEYRHIEFLKRVKLPGPPIREYRINPPGYWRLISNGGVLMQLAYLEGLSKERSLSKDVGRR